MRIGNPRIGTDGAAFHPPRPRIGIGATLARASDLGAKVWQPLALAIRAMQRARMAAVLSEMSDEQLARIGISRSQIPAHARTLLTGEWPIAGDAARGSANG